MELTAVAEIYREETEGRKASFGSGYALGPRHVLTARHVICSTDDTASEIKSISVRRVSSTEQANPWGEAECVWDSSELDLALLRADLTSSGGDVPILPPLGEITGSERIKCEAIGFPRAQQEDNVWDTFRVIGEVDPWTGAKAGRLHIGVSNEYPGTPEGWKGMSGAGLFSQGHFVGTIVTASKALAGRALVASSIADAVRDAGFKAELFGDTPIALRTLPIAAQPVKPLKPDDLAQYLYLADRTPQVRTARSSIQQVLKPGQLKPTVLVVSGVPEDELDILVDRFRYQLLPTLLPARNLEGDLKMGDAEEEVALLSWPDRKGNLKEGLASLASAIRDALDPNHALDIDGDIEPSSIRSLFNERGGPRAFHTYIRAARFDRSQEQLLNAWLGFWNSVAQGNLTEPVIYILCLKYDMQPRSAWSRFNPFATDSELLPNYAKKRLSNVDENFYFTRLDDLEELDWAEDVKTWLKDETLHQRLPHLNGDMAKIEQRIRSTISDDEALRMAHLRERIMDCSFD